MTRERIEGVYVGTVGLVLILDLGTYDEAGTRTAFDLTAYTTRKVVIRTPNGTQREEDATLFGAASEGYLQYALTATDTASAGVVEVIPKVSKDATTLFGEATFFNVNDLFQES